MLEAGAFSAAAPWLFDTLHPATATALTPCVLLTIRAAEARQDGRLRELSTRLAKTLGDEWKVEVLRHYVPFFCDLSIRALRDLAPLLTPELVEPDRSSSAGRGRHLIEEGELGDKLYILVQGEVRIFRERVSNRPAPLEIARITEASEIPYFGEISLHLRVPRTASVQAVERCVLFSLDISDFDAFVAIVPDFEKRVKMLRAVSQARHKAVGAEEAEWEGLAQTPSSPETAAMRRRSMGAAEEAPAAAANAEAFAPAPAPPLQLRAAAAAAAAVGGEGGGGEGGGGGGAVGEAGASAGGTATARPANAIATGGISAATVIDLLTPKPTPRGGGGEGGGGGDGGGAGDGGAGDGGAGGGGAGGGGGGGGHGASVGDGRVAGAMGRVLAKAFIAEEDEAAT